MDINKLLKLSFLLMLFFGGCTVMINFNPVYIKEVINTIINNMPYYFNCARFAARIVQLHLGTAVCSDFNPNEIERLQKLNLSDSYIHISSCYTGKLCNDPADEVCNSCSSETAMYGLTVIIFIVSLIVVTIRKIYYNNVNEDDEDDIDDNASNYGNEN